MLEKRQQVCPAAPPYLCGVAISPEKGEMAAPLLGKNFQGYFRKCGRPERSPSVSFSLSLFLSFFLSFCRSLVGVEAAKERDDLDGMEADMVEAMRLREEAKTESKAPCERCLGPSSSLLKEVFVGFPGFAFWAPGGGAAKKLERLRACLPA